MKYLQKLSDFLSYTNRKNKQVARMIEKKKNYLSMNDDEFLFEYTNIAAKHKHKKFVLAVISITILIATIMNIWRMLYDLIFRLPLSKKAIQMLVVGFLLICLLIVYGFIRSLYRVTKEKVLIDEIKALRNENT